ncbi:hypothetical protein BN2475_1290025 [Paraburkholderia ribeironis]|uniref:Uncharacterized protein n=1 Tax=Paraburkholderia ribeironis TaxID=1247936 RepID=A0A1N7SPA0_9BURK|nr:hypothetical protein BN2475_1290025 [Paraburkholderia ribeironis]
MASSTNIFRHRKSGELLLDQADTEVLLEEVDARRIGGAVFERMNASRVVITQPRKSTPIAFSVDRRTLARIGEHGDARGPRRTDARRTRKGDAHVKHASLTVEIARHPLVLASGVSCARRGVPLPGGWTGDANHIRRDVRCIACLACSACGCADRAGRGHSWPACERAAAYVGCRQCAGALTDGECE